MNKNNVVPTDSQFLEERLMSRQEVAKMICRSPKTVDELCLQGVFTRITFPGRSRASGILASSVTRWFRNFAGNAVASSKQGENNATEN